MSNGFGSLFIGVAGLQSSQNALNITANNLSNIDTEGYVRQSVLFADRNYVTLDTTTAISKQQSGLGVKIGDVVHTRDIFLDRSFRTESSRQAFYAATHEAYSEVEMYFQEMEGQAFQDALTDFWKSFQTLAEYPDDEIYQNLVIQKAQLFLGRANTVYSGLQSYQYNINTQINDDIKQINDLGKYINELNIQIQKVEAGDIETAMTLRDARDYALDQLSELVSISYTETASGVMRVSIEGTEFIDETRCYEMGRKIDKLTGFVTPYWPYLSDTDREKYGYVFNFNTDISSENKNDMGKLKALILARGDHIANYTDVEGMDRGTYNDTTGMSVMLQAEAMLDQLVHGIVTALNNVLCPNTDASDAISSLSTPGATLQVTLADGTTKEIDGSTQILDTENCSTGAGRKLPPQELFTRIGSERYTTATYVDGGETKTIYLYNEEDPDDKAKQYTMISLSVNEVLRRQETELPHLRANGDVDYTMAAELAAIWEKDLLSLNPNDPRPCAFKDYYIGMTGEFATSQEIYGSTATHLSGAVQAIDNQRQQVIGVSSDEELTYMIKYQNAYNAASRYINVVDEMIEHLITQLG